MGKELEAVKAEKVTLRIHGEEREIKFNFSAWAEIEKEYGGFKNVRKLQKDLEETPFATLPHILYIGLVNKKPVEKDGEVYEITEKNILDDYGLIEMKYALRHMKYLRWRYEVCASRILRYLYILRIKR